MFVDTSVFVCLATRIISRNNKMLFQAVYVAVCCSVLQCVAVLLSSVSYACQTCAMTHLYMPSHISQILP